LLDEKELCIKLFNNKNNKNNFIKAFLNYGEDIEYAI
jgi:hypothetical protein